MGSEIGNALRLVWHLARRDLSLAVGRPAQALLPALFFLLVGLLLPFAIGPDAPLIRQLAPGIAWVGALLASLLPVTTLYAHDAEDGTLDQYLTRNIAPETLALARMLALWLSFTLPLLATLPILAAIQGLDLESLHNLSAMLAVGGLGLAALAGIAGALSVGASGGGGLAAIVVLPLALPLLIFGSSGDTGGTRLLVAATILLAGISPIASGAALRTARG